MFPTGVCAVNSSPSKLSANFFAVRSAAFFSAVTQRAPREPRKLRAVGIVHVDHARVWRARPRAREQQPFRREIFFERFVVIEMIPRQVRENRHREMAARKPLHGQRVRTRFEHHMRAARVANLGENLLQVERLRRRIRRRQRAFRRAISRRADQAIRVSRHAQNRIHQKRGRRLPIRSRHAHQLQRIRGMPIEIRRHARQPPPFGTRLQLDPRRILRKLNRPFPRARHGDRPAH